MRFWGHDDAVQMVLEPISERVEFGVILWESRCEESQERPSWIHVDLTGTREEESGHIGTV